MLHSDKEAKVRDKANYNVLLTAVEIEFLIFQMEASTGACEKSGIKNVKELPHYQGLCRILGKFRDALPSW